MNIPEIDQEAGCKYLYDIILLTKRYHINQNESCFNAAAYDAYFQAVIENIKDIQLQNEMLSTLEEPDETNCLLLKTVYNNHKLFNMNSNLEFENLISASLEIYLSNLDPYSKYYHNIDFNEYISRKGFSLIKRKHGYEVNYIKTSSPFNQKINIGDIIVKINNYDWSSYTKIQINKLIEVSMERGRVLNFHINRAGNLIENTIKFQKRALLDGNFNKVTKEAYIKIPYFYSGVANEVKNQIRKHNKSAKKITLDLRGNRGGIIEDAIEVADLFINQKGHERDTVLLLSLIKGPLDGDHIAELTYARDNEKLTSLPLRVLVDKNTASSAEILAGILQYYKRATIVGYKYGDENKMTTYGKGTVQDVFNKISSLNQETYFGTITITSGQYYLPSGRSIDQVGITPDIIVEIEE
ncbi:MAG: S41 family peptidase [Pseudomonadota bacterium]